MINQLILIISIIATVLLSSVFVFILLARPYSFDLIRYVWWRTRAKKRTVGKIKSGNATIFYSRVGTGTPLVLLHGGLSSSLDWYALVPQLTPHFNLLLIDSRGHGRSTFGKRAINYSLLAEDVINVLDALSLQQVDIAGWSDGANVGLLIAQRHASRVRKLVAISANTHPSGINQEAMTNMAQISQQPPSMFTHILYSLKSPNKLSLHRLRSEVSHMWQHLMVLSNSELKQISTPTLLLIGEHDVVVLDHALTIENLMQNATLKVINKVGHNVPQAAAKDVLHNMLAFLSNDVKFYDHKHE